jgi:hypothetical protein
VKETVKTMQKRWYIRNKLHKEHVLELVFASKEDALLVLSKVENNHLYEVFDIEWQQGQ